MLKTIKHYALALGTLGAYLLFKYIQGLRETVAEQEADIELKDRQIEVLEEFAIIEAERIENEQEIKDADDDVLDIIIPDELRDLSTKD